MNDDISMSAQPAAGWRFKVGVALFVLSIALPLVGVTLVATLGLSAQVTASVSGVLLVGAEVLGIIAVAVMGKSGYAYTKNLVFGFLKKYGPPRDVSRLRYTIGLVMFTVPILFGWVSLYTAELIPGFIHTPLPYALGGDFLLLASLFVLGGNFWDKIRALFVYDAEVRFSQSEHA
jgi:hypothetical protein